MKAQEIAPLAPNARVTKGCRAFCPAEAARSIEKAA